MCTTSMEDDKTLSPHCHNTLSMPAPAAPHRNLSPSVPSPAMSSFHPHILTKILPSIGLCTGCPSPPPAYLEYMSQPPIWDTRDTMGKYVHGPVCHACSDLCMTPPVALSKEQPLILFSFKQKSPAWSQDRDATTLLASPTTSLALKPAAAPEACQH